MLGQPNDQSEVEEASLAGPDSHQHAPNNPVNVVPFPTLQADHSSSSAPSVRPVDFRQPALLSPAELRRLRIRHDEFVRSLGARISVYLRIDFNITVSGLETISYRRFLERLPGATQLAMFRVESLSDIGIIETPPAFGLAIVERLLGASTPNATPQVARDLTDLEAAVLDEFLKVVLKEWCRNIAHVSESSGAIAGHENNPRFLLPSALNCEADREVNLLVLSLEMRMADYAPVVMRIATPYAMLDPIIRQLLCNIDRNAETSVRASTEKSVQWNPMFDQLQVSLTAEWHGLQVPARTLAQLKVGDILPVQDDLLQKVQVCVGRVPKFLGRLGTSENTRAVELLTPFASAATSRRAEAPIHQ